MAFEMIYGPWNFGYSLLFHEFGMNSGQTFQSWLGIQQAHIRLVFLKHWTSNNYCLENRRICSSTKVGHSLYYKFIDNLTPVVIEINRFLVGDPPECRVSFSNVTRM